MPLPRRVTERDTGATTVSPTAFAPSRYDTPPRGTPRRGRFARGGGCLLRMAILAVFGLVLLVILGASFAVIE